MSKQRAGMDGATSTPSGSAYPQLRARRNASPETVAAHQRARLHAAMIEIVARNGYAATTVGDVVGLAGVSTKSLYKHFGSKEACFLATYDLVVQQAVGRISAAYRSAHRAEGDWAAGLCGAFDAFVGEMVDHRDPSHLALIDVLGAGTAAAARIERSERVFVRMISDSLAQAPDGAALPPLLLRSLVGGIWFVSRNRILEDDAAATRRCGSELLEWMLAYRSPAAASLPRPAPDWPSPAGAPRQIEGNERNRMLRAAAQIAAAGGYESLTIGQIADLAGVSGRTFSETFESAEECFLASLELLSAQALARALRESSDAPGPAAALCRAVHSLFCQIAQDAVFARATFVEAFAMGPVGIQHRATLMRSFAAVLAQRSPRERRPSPLVAEAIVGAVWTLAHRYVVRDKAHSLRLLSTQAAYLTLAPIVGAEQALETIRIELGEQGEAGGEKSLPAVTETAIALA